LFIFLKAAFSIKPHQMYVLKSTILFIAFAIVLCMVGKMGSYPATQKNESTFAAPVLARQTVCCEQPARLYAQRHYCTVFGIG